MRRSLFLQLLLWPLLSLASPPDIACDALDKSFEEIRKQQEEAVESQVEIARLYELAKSGNCSCQGKMLVTRGIHHYNQSNLVEAKTLLMEAEDFVKDSLRDMNQIGRVYLVLGLIYVAEKNLESAVFYFKKHLSISLERQDRYGVSTAKLNLGLAFLEKGEMEKAETHLKEAASSAEAMGDLGTTGYAYQNLARVLQSRKLFEEALDYARQAENIWKKLGLAKGKYYIGMTFSGIYREIGERDAEIFHLEKALKYGRESGVKLSGFYVHVNLGNAYLDKGEESKAAFHFEKAVQAEGFLQEEQAPIAILNLLKLYYNRQEEHKAEVLVQKLTEPNKKYINNINIEVQRRIQKEHVLSETKDENEVLNKQHVEKENQLKQRNIQLAVVAGLLLLLGYFSYKNYQYSITQKDLLRKIQNQNEALEEGNVALQKSQETILEQKKYLEEKNSLLKNYAYTVSHDLKAPARVVKDFAKILERKIEPLERKDLEEIVSFIKNGSEDMYRLVADVLEYANAKEAALKIEPCSVKSIIDDVLMVELHNTSNRDKFNIQIKNIPETIFADKIKIKQIFNNLINNALKFSADQMQPSVDILGEEKANTYLFHIKDNGAGIPKEQQQEIFQLFSRLASSSEIEGTGVGLAICKTFAEAHGGHIWVAPNPAGGSIFSFSIPKVI